MTFLELALAISGIVLQSGLCLLLAVRRETRNTFPAFLAYNAFEVLGALVELTISGRAVVYFYLYWTTHTVYLVLSFLALYEIIYVVFKNFRKLTWFKFLFPLMALAGLILASARNLLIPTTGGYPLFNTIVSLEIAVQFLQIFVLFLFFVLIRFFRMRRQQYAVGIALGFGISAAGSLVVFLLRSEFGTKLDPVVRSTPPIAYTLALVVWLATFLTPEPAHPLQGKVLALTPEEMLAEIKQYSSTVKKILSR